MANEVKKAKLIPPQRPIPPQKPKPSPRTKPLQPKVQSKTEGGDQPVVAPANYSRGEGQKPVTAAYKENWNLIFGKKN